MNRYNPLEIEAKWQARWEKSQAFRADDTSKKPKMFLAEMFPYPSGAGLHVGHVRNFTIVDVLTRFYAQQELNVLRPFGYDTFGFPPKTTPSRPASPPKPPPPPTSRTSASKPKSSAMPSIGRAKSTPVIPSITNGLSGASSSSSRKASPTKRNLTSGGAP